MSVTVDDSSGAGTPESVEPEAAAAFAERMIDVLSDASTALLLSVGHQTGLFDAMAGAPPSTSAELADRAGLHERYVREWLAGLTVAGVVEHDGGGRHSLPAAHAASLTRAAGPENLAPTMTVVAMMAEVVPKVVRAFREGGGVPYSAYPRFHQLMNEDSTAMLDGALVDAVVPLVDGLAGRLEAGIDVADIGCGSGHAVNLLARSFPNSRCVGYDISDEAIAAARAEAQEWGLDNARFEVRDVAGLGEDAAYDLVTAFDAIHDQAHPAAVLACVARALRPGGRFLMVDIKASSNVDDNRQIPWAPFIYAISTFHCMTVSLAAGGDGLGTAWGRQLATSMLDDAGLTDVAVHELDNAPFNYFFVASKA